MDRYLKNDLLENIVHVIKHVNFQFYRAYPAGVIWKNGKLCKETTSTFYKLNILKLISLRPKVGVKKKKITCVMFNKFILKSYI